MRVRPNTRSRSNYNSQPNPTSAAQLSSPVPAIPHLPIQLATLAAQSLTVHGEFQLPKTHLQQPSTHAATQQSTLDPHLHPIQPTHASAPYYATHQLAGKRTPHLHSSAWLRIVVRLKTLDLAILIWTPTFLPSQS